MKKIFFTTILSFAFLSINAQYSHIDKIADLNEMLTDNKDIFDTKDNVEPVSFWKKHVKLGLGAGMSASTNGVGLNLSTAINDRLGLRLGYEFMNVTAPDQQFSSGKLNYTVEPTVKSGGLSVLVDYKVYKSFYVSGGITRPEFKPSALLVPQNGIKFGDIQYTPSDIGNLEMRMKSKNSIAPTLALGYKHSILKNKRLHLNAEAGTYYTNSLEAEIYGTKLLAVNNNSDAGTLNNFNEELSSMSWSKFYPVLRIGLSYSIF